MGDETMNALYIGTMSSAMRARDLLRSAGHTARLARIAGAEEGCGYQIETDMPASRAAAFLRSHGVRLRSERI